MTYHSEGDWKVATQLVIRPRSGRPDRVLVDTTTVDEVTASVWGGRVCVHPEVLLKVRLDEVGPLMVCY